MHFLFFFVGWTGRVLFMSDPVFQPFDHFVPPVFSGKSKTWTNSISLSVFVSSSLTDSSAPKSPSTRNKRPPASSPRSGWKTPKQFENEETSPLPSPRTERSKSPVLSTLDSSAAMQRAPSPPKEKTATKAIAVVPPVPRRPAAPPTPAIRKEEEEKEEKEEKEEDQLEEEEYLPPLPDAALEAARREELHRLSLLLSAKEREEMLLREQEKEEENQKKLQEKRASPPAPPPVVEEPATKICGVCDSASPASEVFCVECGSKL